MAADTGMNESKMGQNQKLKALKRLDDHASMALNLILKGRRNPDEVALLFLAHQAFRENCLGGVVWKLKERPTADELNAACNLRVGQLMLEDRDQKYLRQRGIKYVGEIFYIFFDRKSRPSVETGERILGVIERQLGIPSDMDPLAEGWIPCYWGEQFDHLINTLILKLAPTPTVEDWDAFVEQAGGARARHHGRRGPGRKYHRMGINYVGQLLWQTSSTPGCPANCISAGKLSDLRVTLNELGSTLWAGAKLKPDYLFPDCSSRHTWIAEEQAIAEEQILIDAAIVRRDERREREAKQRHDEREARKQQALQEAQKATKQNAQEHASKDKKPSITVLLNRLDEVDMSVRLANCLQNAGIETVGQAVTRSLPQYLKTSNFGRKSIGELQDLLWEEYRCWIGERDDLCMKLSDFAECAPSAN